MTGDGNRRKLRKYPESSEDATFTSVTSFERKSSALMPKETLPVELITDRTCGWDP